VAAAGSGVRGRRGTKGVEGEDEMRQHGVSSVVVVPMLAACDRRVVLGADGANVNVLTEARRDIG